MNGKGSNMMQEPMQGSEMSVYPTQKKHLPPIDNPHFQASDHSDLHKEIHLQTNVLPEKYEQLLKSETVVEVYNLTKGSEALNVAS